MPSAPASGPCFTCTLRPTCRYGYGSARALFATPTRSDSISSSSSAAGYPLKHTKRTTLGSLQHPQAVFKTDMNEDIPRKQSEFQLLLSILPAPDAAIQWQEAADTPFLELFPHMFFMTRTCVCRVPSGRGREYSDSPVESTGATTSRNVISQAHLVGSQRCCQSQLRRLTYRAL